LIDRCCAAGCELIRRHVSLETSLLPWRLRQR
jgi:hypothetical protein